MPHVRALLGSVLVAALVPGCFVVSRVHAWMESREADDAATDAAGSDGGGVAEEAGETVSPDAIALAEALMPAPKADAAPVAETATPAALDELEVRDFEAEWIEHTGGGYYGYYGYGTTKPPKVLRVAGRAKVKVATGEKAEVVIKASCDDGGYAVTDADVSPIDDSPVGRIPAVGTEFRIGAKLFVAAPPTEPSACRVTVMLRDPSRTPERRGGLERCVSREHGRPGECTPESAPVRAEAEPTWSVADAQFLPTGELGFSVVAGQSRAPDRVAVRATCNAGDKQFVEFKYLTGRWYALEPGESLRVREQLQSSWEFMRYTDCDLEIQDASYDAVKQQLRGVKAIAKLCTRPSGLREGTCRRAVPEPPAPDPSGVPAKLEVQHGGSNAYMGWYNAYVMSELTLSSSVPVGTTLDFIAHCGTRTEKQQVTLQTPLELVYPGQTLRAQGNVSFTGKVRPKSCTTEMVLSSKDAAGTPVTWSLGTQCYDKHGTYVLCPGATTGTLGISGVGAGSRPAPPRFR